MAHQLVDYGEEFLLKHDVTTYGDLIFGLYNDGTDGIADTDDLAAITTEPDGGSYARLTVAVDVYQIDGDWGWDNAAEEAFDVSDSNNSVDSYFYAANFDSEMDADAAVDHLVVTGALSQTYDLGSVDTLNISASSAGVSVS